MNEMKVEVGTGWIDQPCEHKYGFIKCNEQGIRDITVTVVCVAGCGEVRRVKDNGEVIISNRLKQ